MQGCLRSSVFLRCFSTPQCPPGPPLRATGAAGTLLDFLETELSLDSPDPLGSRSEASIFLLRIPPDPLIPSHTKLTLRRNTDRYCSDLSHLTEESVGWLRLRCVCVCAYSTDDHIRLCLQGCRHTSAWDCWHTSGCACRVAGTHSAWDCWHTSGCAYVIAGTHQVVPTQYRYMITGTHQLVIVGTHQVVPK